MFEKIEKISKKIVCIIYGHRVTPTHIEFGADGTVEVTYYCLRCKAKINKIH